jgi:hypothetical protein
VTLRARAADSWRAIETWIRCLSSYSVRLHAVAGLSAPSGNATKVPGGIPRRLSSYRRFRYPLRPCRSSNRPDRPNAHSRRMPVPPAPVAQGSDNWTVAVNDFHRIAQSPGGSCRHSRLLYDQPLSHARAKPQFPHADCTPTNNPQLRKKPATKSRRSLRFGNV